MSAFLEYAELTALQALVQSRCIIGKEKDIEIAPKYLHWKVKRIEVLVQH